MTRRFSPERPHTITRGLLAGRSYESESAYRRDLKAAQFEVIHERYERLRSTNVKFYPGREDYMSSRADEYGLSNQQFERHYSGAVQSGWSTEAHGAYAKLLEFLGWREDDADYDVGDTPGGE